MQLNLLFFQVSQDLLLENQYEYFIELIKDIVRQLKLNPNQLPTPQAPRRNLDKVSWLALGHAILRINNVCKGKRKREMENCTPLLCGMITREDFPPYTYINMYLQRMIPSLLYMVPQEYLISLINPPTNKQQLQHATQDIKGCLLLNPQCVVLLIFPIRPGVSWIT